jgi:predicted nucleotidyltransferase
METTQNKMPLYNNLFFTRLKNYLDTKIYFFGSIQRFDYFPKKSDIDVAIFTDNIHSTISKLQVFLNVKHYSFKKFVWRLNYNNVLINGYKIMYKEPDNNFITEISIYNDKFKEFILIEHNSKSKLPFYATICLVVIKYLFYTLNIISADWYIYLKKYILSTLIFKKIDDFVVVDIKDDK